MNPENSRRFQLVLEKKVLENSKKFQTIFDVFRKFNENLRLFKKVPEFFKCSLKFGTGLENSKKIYN
jgi:hypothetical protein